MMCCRPQNKRNRSNAFIHTGDVRMSTTKTVASITTTHCGRTDNVMKERAAAASLNPNQSKEFSTVITKPATELKNPQPVWLAVNRAAQDPPEEPERSRTHTSKCWAMSVYVLLDTCGWINGPTKHLSLLTRSNLTVNPATSATKLKITVLSRWSWVSLVIYIWKSRNFRTFKKSFWPMDWRARTPSCISSN